MSASKYLRLTVDARPVSQLSDADIRRLPPGPLKTLMHFFTEPEHDEFELWAAILEKGDRTDEEIRLAFFKEYRDNGNHWPFNLGSKFWNWETNEAAKLFMVMFPQTLQWIDEHYCRVYHIADIQFCRSPEDLQKLCDVLFANQTLKRIQFGGISVLSNEMVDILARNLKCLMTLRCIRFDTDQPATNFDELIRAESYLRVLELWECELGDAALTRIAGALRTNRRLTDLTFLKTLPGDDGIRAITRELKRQGEDRVLSNILIITQRKKRAESEAEMELSRVFHT